MAKFVDAHSKFGGILENGRWRTTSYKPFERPGKGYWDDKHKDYPPVQSFRPSTAELKNAQQRPAPKYIGNNQGPETRKSMYMVQLNMYHRCRKVLVSRDGTVFRATDAEIEARLKKDGGVAESLKAGFYVKVISETRRRGEERARAKQQRD